MGHQYRVDNTRYPKTNRWYNVDYKLVNATRSENSLWGNMKQRIFKNLDKQLILL